MCKSFNKTGVFFPSSAGPPALLSLSLSFFMQFVDILFYIIIVCDLVLVIFRLQSCFLLFTFCSQFAFHIVSQPNTHCACALRLASSAMICSHLPGSSEPECSPRANKKSQILGSNGQNQRDLIEMIFGGIHLQVCIFGLLKNCNDLGVSKSSHEFLVSNHSRVAACRAYFITGRNFAHAHIVITNWLASNS